MALRRKLTLSLCIAVAGSVFPLLAQNNDELNAGIEFNFSNPGARSLALGGAFTALADDATAAYANPAGLVILAKPEVAGEGRRFEFNVPYVDRGHVGAPPTGRGLDTIAELTNASTASRENALSFLSFSYPSDRWAFAVYRHQVAKFATKVQSTAIFSTDAGSGFVNRLFPTQGDLAIDVANYGVSGAVRIGDRLMVGAGVSYYLARFSGELRRYGHGIPGNAGTGLGQDFGAADYSDANLISYTLENGNDSDIGVNLGVIYSASDRWSLGAVYRRGPSFDVEAARYFLAPDRSSILFRSTTNPLRVPDVFAFGAAFRPAPGWVVAMDIDQVRYSQLVQDFGDLLRVQSPDSASLRYKVDDAVEVRLGTEYVFRGRVPVAVRLGGWFDPDHRIRFDPGPVTTGDAAIFSAIAFQRGEDQTHITGGFGFVFPNVGQIDFAADIAERTKTFSASFVTRFGS
jgi:long-subunit fatty acid transport protein